MAYEWTQIGYWNKPNLSWTIYLIFAVLLGFFGIDHLYMRSPFTAFLKFIVNIFTLGFWYFYDVVNAFTEGDLVKMYGVGTPFAPTGGIGAGMFTDYPDKEHSPWGFMAYSLTSGFPFGLFGVNNFIAGDKKGGFIKLWTTLLFCFPLILLAPLGWTLGIGLVFYTLYVIFFDTESLFSKGVPSPFGRHPSSLGPTIAPKEVDSSGFVGTTFAWFLGLLKGFPIVGPMIKEAEEKAELAIGTAMETAKVVKASTVDVALAGAQAAKTLAVDVPMQATRAVAAINDGIQQKIGALPSPTAGLKKDLFGLPDLPAGPPGFSEIGKKSLKKRLFGLPDLPAGPPIQLPMASAPPIQLPIASAPPIQLPMASAPPIQLPMASAPPMQLPIQMPSKFMSYPTRTMVGGSSNDSMAGMALMGLLYGGLVIAIGNLLYRQYKKTKEDKKVLEGYAKVLDVKTGSKHESGLSDVPPIGPIA